MCEGELRVVYENAMIVLMGDMGGVAVDRVTLACMLVDLLVWQQCDEGFWFIHGIQRPLRWSHSRR